VDDKATRWFLLAGSAMLVVSAALFLVGAVGYLVLRNDLGILVMIVAFGGLVSGFGVSLARGQGG
jgi:NADH:ubiquinone oxidoreductase subunit K